MKGRWEERKRGKGEERMGRGEMREVGGRDRREERIKERQRKTVFPLKDATQRHNRPHSISLRRKMTEREERNKQKEMSLYKTLKTKREGDVPGAYLKQ